MRFALIALLAYVVGCGDSGGKKKPEKQPNEQAKVEPPKAGDPGEIPQPPKKKRKLPDLSFGTKKKPDNPPGGGEPAKTGAKPPVKVVTRAEVRKALEPFQVWVGKWRGTARLTGARHEIDFPAWRWDMKTEPKRPALVMESDKSFYFRAARLTYFPERSAYQLTVTDPKRKTRVLEGKFSQAPRDEPDGPKRTKRTFILQLAEVKPEKDGQKLMIEQVDNNRFRIEIENKRKSGRFLRFATVNTQREGTSIAKLEDDYGDRTCVISQGLGTIAVTHKGKTYYVCCTGCRDAFNDDPEHWIARFEKMKAEKK